MIPTKNFFAYYGGKNQLADWIISNFPSNYTNYLYIEPFFGSGAVFFNKTPSKREVINDIDDMLYIFYRVAQQNPVELYNRLKRIINFETEFNWAADVCTGKIRAKTDIDLAVAVWVNISFSYNHTKGHSGMYYDNSKLPNSKFQKAMNKVNFSLKKLFERLKYAIILKKDALKALELYNKTYTFAYMDPPYFDSNQKYEHKYTKKDFKNLITYLKTFKGKFALSGYSKNLDCGVKIPKKWSFAKIQTKCQILKHLPGEPAHREEVLIMNYAPQNFVQKRLF